MLTGCALGVDESALPEGDAGKSEQAWGTNNDGGACLPPANCWVKHKEIQENAHPYLGSPAWSEDGARAAAVELSYERQIQFPPLQGWWSKRNFSFRLFTQRPNSWRWNYVGDRAIPGNPLTLYFMKKAGYFLVNRYVEYDGMDYVRVAHDGSWVAFAQTDFSSGLVNRQVIPSPDGSVLVDATCRPRNDVLTDGVLGTQPLRPVPCSVQFLDSQTLEPTGARFDVELDKDLPADAEELSWVTWTPASTVVVTDHQSRAVELTVLGDAQDIAVPACKGPTTTSSRVAANGTTIGISWGMIRKTGTADAGGRFGCR